MPENQLPSLDRYIILRDWILQQAPAAREWLDQCLDQIDRLAYPAPASPEYSQLHYLELCFDLNCHPWPDSQLHYDTWRDLVRATRCSGYPGLADVALLALEGCEHVDFSATIARVQAVETWAEEEHPDLVFELPADYRDELIAEFGYPPPERSRGKGSELCGLLQRMYRELQRLMQLQADGKIEPVFAVREALVECAEV